MKLGFSVETLLPAARVHGPLRMGLSQITKDEWLQPEPDVALRTQYFKDFPDCVVVRPDAEPAVSELVGDLNMTGDLTDAAQCIWEDICILTRPDETSPWLLNAGAVAFPTDWRIADKMGKDMLGVHAPIHGYAAQLGEGVARFLDNLPPGKIYGRANAFVVANDNLRYLPDTPPEARFRHVNARNAGDTLYVRCERQTLSRLPVTGAIIFTIGVYRESLGSISTESVKRISRSVEGFRAGEGDRRAVPYYAGALMDYANRRA